MLLIILFVHTYYTFLNANKYILHHVHRFIYTICCHILYHIPRDGQHVYVNKHHFSEQTKFSLLNDLTQLNFIDQKNLI